MFFRDWFGGKKEPAAPTNPQKRQDFFLQNTPDQPKRVIGDYVAKNGILVPTRYDSLKDALASGKRIIARSEHRREYAGESGIMESNELDEYRYAKDETALKNAIIKESEGNFPKDCRMAQYARYNGMTPEEFKQGVSFSLWEMLGGNNLAMTADSAVPNKYHVFRKKFVPVGEYFSIENGKITYQTTEIPPNLMKSIMNLPSFYEQVRNLPNFNPTHCPIIEAQIVDGKTYFLQYHRGRDFEPAGFELGTPNAKQKEVMFVRGATEREGRWCILTMEYNVWGGRPLPEKYDGYFGFEGYNTVYTEMLLRRTGVWVKYSRKQEGGLPDDLDHMATHRGMSQLFKPEISIIMGENTLLEADYEKMIMTSHRLKGDLQIPIRLVSDGRKAFIEWI
jgi:hypothetical protein